jgi:hypothetical protein
MRKPPEAHVETDSCFLNIPYDKSFENLYLAYIIGLTALGFTPRATLGFPRDSRRLDRIFNLVQSCRFLCTRPIANRVGPKPSTIPTIQHAI